MNIAEYRESSARNMQEGMEHLATAGNNKAILGVSLLCFYTALEDHVRASLASDPHLNEQEQAEVLGRKTEWLSLTDLLLQVGKIDVTERKYILDTNRKRNLIAHRRPHDITKQEVEDFAEFVKKITGQRFSRKPTDDKQSRNRLVVVRTSQTGGRSSTATHSAGTKRASTFGKSTYHGPSSGESIVPSVKTGGLVSSLAKLLLVVIVVFFGVRFLANINSQEPTKAIPSGNKKSSSVPKQPATQVQSVKSAPQSSQIMKLEQEVKINPDNVVAWTQLGNLYFDNKQVGNAIYSYNKSLGLNQGQPDVWTDLGVVYRQNNQFKESLAALDYATYLKPSQMHAWYNKGVVLIYNLGDKEGGIQAWKQALEIDPNAKAPNGQMIRELLSSVSAN
jgi:cytochrome c-type biogenesis protein CcmH/NrfG